MFDELKEEMYFKEITDLKSLIIVTRKNTARRYGP